VSELEQAEQTEPLPSPAAEPTVDTDSAGAGDEALRALEQEGDVAADYLEGLLDIADYDGDLDLDVEGDRAMVAIEGEGLADLVGPEGSVLDALQDLTRLAVLRETGRRSRLMLDIAGWRRARREALTALGTRTAESVKAGGEPVRLEPMTPFERKVVHDAVAAAGLRSESEGEEPDRCVVVLPA
jgi:spoIIIJ-associated protein